MTHTLAILEIGQLAFDDIKRRIDDLNTRLPGHYSDMFLSNGAISLHGVAVQPERPETATKRCCEVCDTPADCMGGRTPCNLSGEFAAHVPLDVANRMLTRIAELEAQLREDRSIFEEYALAHQTKADKATDHGELHNRTEKAKRNAAQAKKIGELLRK